MPITRTTSHGLRLRTGARPLLFVAPHGGRRHAGRRPWARGSIRVNDLYTAELALDLAERLDAYALVNADVDRNDIDLNRVRQIRLQAPWFLDLLAGQLHELQRHGGRATVLFIHGWNVGNPAVDIGIGLPRDARQAGTPAPSADERFVADSIGTLREHCTAHGIESGLGWRYPATNAGNLVQLFTGRHLRSAEPRVREVARAGLHINAAQLELSIPLRWPGPWRQRFIDACLAAFGASGAPPRPARSATSLAPERLTSRPGAGRLALQFQSADGGLAGAAAFDFGDIASGRLLLLPPEGGLYLFTGEAPDTSTLSVGPLRLRLHAPDRIALSHHGPLLAFADRSPFLDLESGLATARLARAALDIELALLEPSLAGPDAHGPPCAGGGFARVSGTVRLQLHSPEGELSGTPHLPTSIAGAGYVEDRPVAPRHRALVTIPDHPRGPLRLLWRHQGAPTVHVAGESTGAVVPADAVRIRAAGAGPLLEFPLPGNGATMRTVQERSVPIVRQGTEGRVHQHVLAFCEFESEGAPAGAGWVELSL